MRRSDFAALPPLVLESEGEIYEVPDYVTIADRYAAAVASGNIPRCREMILAARRYLKMRDQAEKPKGEFYFSPEHVIDYCCFQEKLRHVESGNWEITQQDENGNINPRIFLEPSQIWVESAIQGFRRRNDGTRLVSRAIECVPRKNAKTTALSGAALFDLCCSGQVGPQICIASSSVKQSDDTIYGIMIKQVARNADLVEQYDIDWTKDRITSGDGIIFKLTSMGERQDGLNPSLAIFEEGHAGADSVYRVIRSAFGARPNALLRMITTAGYRPEGPAYDLMLEAKMILEGKVDDPTFFAAIYTLDKEDYVDPESKAIDWNRLLKNERLVAKANPLYMVSLQPHIIAGQLKEALTKPSERGEVARTRFNIWTGAGATLIDEVQWAACKTKFDLSEFFNQKCWMAVDLAGYDDMCAIGLLFERGERIYGFVKYFIPEGSSLLLDPELHDIIVAWRDAGWLDITEGPEPDYDRIEAEILVYGESFDVQGLGFDPYQSNQISKRCFDKGLPVFRYTNSAATMTTPTDDILSRVVGKRFAHDGNGVLAWNASNVHGDKRDNGSIMPRKEKKGSKRKVDGFITLVMANGLRLGVDAKAEHDKTPTSAYAVPDRVIGLEATRQ